MLVDFFKVLINPFTLLFMVLAIGNVLAKVKIGKFKFGISGNLFTGLFVGWLIITYLKTIPSENIHYEVAQKIISGKLISSTISHLFLYLFICAVGLASAKDLKTVLKKYGLKFISLAIIITLSGGAMTYGIRPYIGSGLFEMSGVFTAAMTSSPGLAAALESSEASATKIAINFPNLNDQQKNTVLKAIDKTGKLNHKNTVKLTKEQQKIFIEESVSTTGASNAIGFPFGVIIVILSMTILPKLFRIDIEQEKLEFEKELREMKLHEDKSNEIEECFFDLAAFSFAIFIGFLLGSIKIYLGPIGYFSLGNTGGILISSLSFGHIGRLKILNFRMNEKVLGVIKNFGLGSFVSIIGITYGYRVIKSLSNEGLSIALFTLIIAFTCMCIGVVVGKYIFKINWVMLSGAICGSMTATPGLGAAIDSLGTDEAGSGYAATYPFALIGMVLFSIILNNLPL